MASINGIQIKSLKSFKDHDGYTVYQGNIYYKGKKLGFWSEDSWGGCDTFHFDESILDAEVERYRKSHMVEDRFRSLVSIESMLIDIVHLMDDEKMYKKALKNGHTTLMIATDGYHVFATSCVSTDDRPLKMRWRREFVDDCKKQFFDTWDGKVTFYESLDDFNVTV